MAAPRILVVDQYTEIRKMVDDALKSFGQDFNVVYVPSGEEALLESRAQNFSLLVSCLVLPGVDGLEVIRKVKDSFQDVKTILVADEIQLKARTEEVNELVDFVFQPPIDQADFQHSVGKCLGLIESRLQERGGNENDPPSWNLSERLTNLRQELGAISSVVLDEHGTVLARSGDLPDVWVESSLFPSVMASFNTSNKVARFLQAFPPRDFWHISGKEFDLILAHVSDKISLLEIVNPIPIEADFNNIVRIVRAGVSDIHDILLNLGVNLEAEEEPDTEKVETTEESLEAEAPRIEAMFQEVGANLPETVDVDAFWSTFATQEMTDGIENPDALTYEQAIQLGLAPDDD